MEDDLSDIDVLLLGDTSCGKSTFLSAVIRTRGGAYSKQGILPALGDHDQPFEIRVKLSSGYVRFRFFDTAFPDNYISIHPHMVVFCFDIGNPESLASVQQRWHKEAITHYETSNEYLAKMLLGLKRDLRDTKSPFIDPYEALAAAQSMRLDQYAECSVSAGTFIDKSFQDIVHLGARMCLKPGDYEGGGCYIV